jgi:PA14 domain-containing protein/calcineurin-like phosphoesterase family protein
VVGRFSGRRMAGLVTRVGLIASVGLAFAVVVPPVAPALPEEDPVIAAAGDIACPANIATPTTCRHQYTSDILASRGFDAVLPLGDNQYLTGALSDFQAYYDPTWGRVKSITHPTPGNNDYQTPGASGYFGYFGAAAGDPQKGYYSYDLGSWHIIALNSNCSNVGGCEAGSPQEQWLRADLASKSNACTLAYWHHARFSSGTAHGSDARTQALWQALYDFHADVVLSGHEHNYERFAPQAPTGAADPANGIREFVVGTGGRNLYAFGSPIANSIVRNSATFGVLKLALHSASYEWQFLPEAGSSFTDSGSAACTDPLDFALNATPLTRTVTPGTGTTYSVTVRRSGGFSGPVALSVSGLPSGASASFVPNPVVASTPTSSSLSVTTSATTTPGTYNLTITGASGAISHSRAVTLVVSGGSGTCSTGQYRAEYFNNRTLSGSPTLSRCEAAINYDWGSGGPGGGIGTDDFSVRWTGSHSFAAGTYTFTARADDGIRVWVDGGLIIDAWRDQAPTTYKATRTLTAGQHQVKVEYYERGGGAVAQVAW